MILDILTQYLSSLEAFWSGLGRSGLLRMLVFWAVLYWIFSGRRRGCCRPRWGRGCCPGPHDRPCGGSHQRDHGADGEHADGYEYEYEWVEEWDDDWDAAEGAGHDAEWVDEWDDDEAPASEASSEDDAEREGA